jgi:type II secretory pathway component PulF
VLSLLIIFFVPQFEPIFKSLQDKGKDLPTLTVLVLGVSRFMQGWGGLVVLGSLVGLIVAYRAWAATPGGRMALDGFRLRVPGLGGVLQSYALSRFTRVLGTLLHNGIPILQSLRIAKDSAGNKVISEAIEKAADNITGGNKLASPLAACKYFPRDVVEMISVGEESNNLDKVLIDIAEGLEKRTARNLDLFVKLLEPCMLLTMAAITLVVVLGLLLPVFNIGNAV